MGGDVRMKAILVWTPNTARNPSARVTNQLRMDFEPVRGVPARRRFNADLV